MSDRTSKPMNTSTDLVIPETNHCQEFRASLCGDKNDLVYMVQGFRDICIDAGTVRALRDWLNQAFPAETKALHDQPPGAGRSTPEPSDLT